MNNLMPNARTSLGGQTEALADLAVQFAPPRASLAMPKQVLTPAPGRMMRVLRSWLAVAPGLRRLG